MENLEKDYLTLKHKILFFFMPKSIVFTKKELKDSENVALLKAVSPCFYWCSAHEFLTEHEENKYLFQYQIYFLNGENLEPAKIIQHWSKSKNDIRNEIFSFLDIWREDHEKALINPNMPIQNAKFETQIPTSSDFKSVYNFSDFAEFVAKSIYHFKNNYVQQAKLMNFDFVQKEFWRHIALNPNACKEMQKYLNINITKKTKKIATKKTVKNGKKQKTKNTPAS